MTSCVICIPRGPDEQPHEPAEGWLCCWRSMERMRAALWAIPELCAELHGLGFVMRDDRDPVSRVLPSGPLNGSNGSPRVNGSREAPIPIRIDPTDLLAPSRMGSLSVAVTGRYPSDQIGNLAVATELEFWVRDWADIRREGVPLPIVPELAGWLLNRLEWACATHPALDEFAEKLRTIRSALTAAAGRFDAPPETLSAPCPACGMLSLYRDLDLERIACGNDMTLMTYDEYARHVIGTITPKDPTMQKIPTLFLRDPEDMKRVTREVHPDCQWVLDGEGVATQKWDGTCVMFDGKAWWARREVKAGKNPPPLFTPVQYDPATSKTVGWEPIEHSAFAKYFREALANGPTDRHIGTYELVGPKVNGNPEKLDRHALWRHEDSNRLPAPRDFDGLREYLTNGWFTAEGIVWHHPDGRMAKLKRRDFPTPMPAG